MCFFPPIMVTPSGLEPETARLEISCSIQLSYGATDLLEMDEGACGLRLTALLPLTHAGVCEAVGV